MKTAKLGLLIIAFVFSAKYASAIDSDAGTGGAAFLKIPASSARTQSLGNCGAAIIEGAEAMGVNPAGIASSQMKELSFSYLSWFQDYSGQYLAYVHPIGQSVIGFNAAYYGISGFDTRDSNGVPRYGEQVKVKNGYATISLARAFFLEKFLAGFSVKGVLEDNYVKEYKNIVFDSGVVLKIGRKIALGWSGQNFSSGKEDVVEMQRLSFALMPSSFVTLIMENKSYSDGEGKLGSGFEFTLPEEVLQVGRVSFRVGYTDADNHGQSFDESLINLGLASTTGWTFGFGIYSSEAFGYGMGLDYAFVPYGSLGKSSQIVVRLQF